MKNRQTIENKMYGQPRQYDEPRQAETCGLSTVDPLAKIIINGVEHAGIVTHICSLESKHEKPSCRCVCGASWLRNVK